MGVFRCCVLVIGCLSLLPSVSQAMSAGEPFLPGGANADPACNINLQAGTVSTVSFNSIYVEPALTPDCSRAPVGAATIETPLFAISAPITLKCNASAFYNVIEESIARSPTVNIQAIKSMRIAASLFRTRPLVRGYVWSTQPTPPAQPSLLLVSACFNIQCDPSSHTCVLEDPAEQKTLYMIHPAH